MDKVLSNRVDYRVSSYLKGLTMDVMGLGSGLAYGSTSTTIPVLKKAMETQETLMGQLLEGVEASNGQSQQASSLEAIQQATIQTGRGISLDVRA